MDIILLERVAKLGQMGETVTVKDGYARNYLLPQGKALRANRDNLAYFETQRASLEQKNAERISDAEGQKERLDGTTYVAVRSAGETGQLYGSVSARDVGDILSEAGFKVPRNAVELQQPIKMIGLHEIEIALHPDVTATVTINVARSEDEAVRQADGEDLTRRDYDDEEEAVEEPDVEAVFDNPDDVDLTDVQLEELVDEDGPAGEATAEGEPGALDPDASPRDIPQSGVPDLRGDDADPVEADKRL